MAAPQPPPPPPPPPPPHPNPGGPGTSSPATPARPQQTSARTGPLLLPDFSASSSAAPTFSPLSGVFINQHVPLVLSLNPPNFSQWRTLFEVMFQKYAVTDHLAGPPRPADPVWLQDDAHVVSWLYNRVNAEIFGLIHQRGATAADVWASICSLFLENREHQQVLLSTEFRRIEQGSSSIIAYFARLKECADRLADLGAPVGDRDQVLNMLHGLHPRYRYAVPILTMQTPFPSFLRCRAFLLIEESRQSDERSTETALHVSRTPANSHNGGGDRNSRGGGRNKGKGKASGGGGGQTWHNGGGSSSHTGGVAAPRPPAPAPAPWTGMVHAWPMPWRPHAPGAGILGPRPDAPSPFAGVATHHAGAPPPYPYGPPTVWQPGVVPPHPLYEAPPVGGPSSNTPAWDQSALVHALNAMTLQQQQQTTTPSSTWYLDSGATSHMASSSGSKNEEGDPPM
ncbi:uncharacterized protein LOC119360489 [Triticum dicoccoides]|uniref:uncharacterized protein LOC119360489 n=1 Tax=Triticum dicoccoides TaxID=85692 RepID=UPI00188EBB83|nr:uncharacterized protein LOC119360489 [Triticum dicoccoides]